jgi:hypothetical protein
LLTVIRSHDYLPEKYVAREDLEPRITENEQELEKESDAIQEIVPDPSIHEPLSANGMTAAKAWSTVLDQLKVNMPKASYDKWVRDAVLISYKDGTFVIGVYGAYDRDWLSSRLTSTSKCLLITICSQCVACFCSLPCGGVLFGLEKTVVLGPPLADFLFIETTIVDVLRINTRRCPPSIHRIAFDNANYGR